MPIYRPRSGRSTVHDWHPYTPQENPVEDLWLKGKTFVRTHALWTTCFEQIKDLFVKGIRQKKYYQFPKLMQYTLALK